MLGNVTLHFISFHFISLHCIFKNLEAAEADLFYSLIYTTHEICSLELDRIKLRRDLDTVNIAGWHEEMLPLHFKYVLFTLTLCSRSRPC